MPGSFNLQTFNYEERRLDSQDLDLSNNVQKLMLTLGGQYDSGAAPVLLREGFFWQMVDYIQMRDGGNIPLKIYGRDMLYLLEILNQMPNGWVQPTVVPAQANQPTVNNVPLPIQFSSGMYKTPIIEILWGLPADLGADYVIDFANLNGTYSHTNLPVVDFRIVPDTSITGEQGEQRIRIPSEGALTWVLVISRANLTPFTPRDGLINPVSFKIEGDYREFQPEVLLNEYSAFTKQPESVGAYLIRLEDKPMIGNNSEFQPVIDAVDTDLSIYFGYTRSGSIIGQTAPDITGIRKVSASPRRRFGRGRGRRIR